MTEYGAQLNDGVVYMHEFSLRAVVDFITEYGTVTPLHLVCRECNGDNHGRWITATI